MDSTAKFKIPRYIESLRLDEHAVAFFRILLGLSVLYNLVLVKYPYAIEFWGEHTIIPIDIMNEMNGPKAVSVFDFIRSDLFAKLYMIAAILSALLFTVGYKSRYNAVVLLFLYWNLLQSAAMWIGGYDFYNFHLLFWSVFLPLDNRFSVQKPVRPAPVSLSISVVLLVQISLIYFTTGLAKYGPAWTDGYAVKIMASDKWAAYSTAAIFAKHVLLYKPLTYVTLAFEYAFPVLVFIPLYISRIPRYLAVLFLLGFHGTIMMIYDVANFPIAGFAAAALLLPSAFWKGTGIGAMEQKAVQQIDHLSKLLRYAKYLFTVIALYMIVLNNIKFIAKYTPLNKFQAADKVYQNAAHISFISPVRISVFFQFWKMFAPEPIRDIGWMSIEEKKDDGYLYDLFTGNIISPTEHKLNFKPSGFEFHLLIYARAMRFKNKQFTRVFLKYWFLHQLKIRNIPEDKYGNYFLAEYRYYYPPGTEDDSALKIERNYFNYEFITTMPQ
jgi:hypothetical protein